MEKTINHVKNCIAEVANGLIYIMVGLAIFSYFPEHSPHFAAFALFAVIPLAAYLTRCLVHQLWLFFPLHLLVPLVIFFVFRHSIGQVTMFLFVAVIQIWVSIAIRVNIYVNPNRSDFSSAAVPPIVPVAVGAILYMLTGLGSLVALVTLSVALHLLHRFLAQFVHYSDMTRRTTGTMPTKRIFTVDFLLVAAFTLATVLLMAVFSGSEILTGVGAWLLECLRLLLVWFFSVFSVVPEDMPVLVGQGPITPVIPAELIAAEERVKGPIAAIVEQILIAFATALVLALILAALVTLILLIRRAFKKRARVIEASPDEEKGDVVEVLKRRVSRERGPRRRLLRSADEKIRQIFAAVIMKRMGQADAADISSPILAGSTAREMLAVFPDEPEAALRLTDLYEKARYARESCTAADVRMARGLAREMSKTNAQSGKNT